MSQKQPVHQEATLELLRATLDGVQDIVMVIGADYQVRLMNQAAQETYFSDGETTPLHCYKVSHGRDAPCDGIAHPCPLDQVRESLRPLTVMHQHIRRDGEKRTVEINASPLLEEDGAFAAIVESAHDVTARVEAESRRDAALEALLESAETARGFLNAPTDTLILIDLEGYILTLNKEAARRLGKPVEEIVGMCAFDLIPPDLAVSRRARIAEVIRTGKPVRFEDKRAGIHFDNSLYPIFDTTGKVERLVIFGRDVTERVQMEKTLREAELRYRTVANFTYDWEYWENPDGTLRYVSPTCERITGYTVEQFMAKPRLLDELVLPADGRVWAEHHHTAAESPRLREVLFRIRRRDGETIWVEHACRPVMDEQGVFMGFRASNRDVTARVHAKDALRESEARYRALFDNMGDGVAIYEAVNDGEDFKFVDFNRAGEEIDCVKREHLVGKSVLGMFPGVKDFGLFEVFQRVWATGAPERHPVSTYEDERISGWRENFVYKLPSGEIVAVYSDETEHRQVLETLQMLSSAVEQSHEGIAVVDIQGNIRFVNDAFAAVHGYTPKELAGAHLSIFHTPEQLPSVQAANRQIRETGEFMGEIWHARRDGTLFPTLMHNSLLRDEAGNPTHMIGTLHDITERVQAEEQIKASLKEKELLLREIHHRVKNNLQIISSLLNMQARSIKDEQVVETLRDSRNRIRSMALVHEKLYRTPDLAQVDFARYIRSIAAAMLRSYRVRVRDINLDIEASDVTLGIDMAVPCGLMVNELLSNALKHAFPPSPPGATTKGQKRPEIHVGLCSDQDTFTLTVRDNGVGFPPDLDFQKAESMGLRLVVMLTKQLKGSVELDRSAGTTVKIVFGAQGARKEPIP